MITYHSIDLKFINDPCFAETVDGWCRVLIEPDDHCRTQKCPFYKPRGCKDWIRIEDRSGIAVVPAEEYFRARTAEARRKR